MSRLRVGARSYSWYEWFLLAVAAIVGGAEGILVAVRTQGSATGQGVGRGATILLGLATILCVSPVLNEVMREGVAAKRRQLKTYHVRIDRLVRVHMATYVTYALLSLMVVGLTAGHQLSLEVAMMVFGALMLSLLLVSIVIALRIRAARTNSKSD